MSDCSEDPAAVLDHENLDVYRLALDFVEQANKAVLKLPKPISHMADQLSRASTSVVLNIAEGSGRGTSADQARFFKIAMGSAKECGAALDVLHRTENLTFQDHARGKVVLKRVVSMLFAMTKRLDGAPGRRTCGLCGR